MKNNLKRLFALSVLVAGVSPLFQQSRAQYIDPGTGNFLFQIIVSGLFFLVFFFSRIRRGIMHLLKGKGRSDKTENGAQ